MVDTIEQEEFNKRKEDLFKNIGFELSQRRKGILTGNMGGLVTNDKGQELIEVDVLEEDTKQDKEDLRKIYNKIAGTIRFYLDMPEDKINIVTLWIMGTYLHKEFETFPYLFVNAMRGSGKTRLLKLIAKMSKDGQMISSVTQAVLFRTEGTLCLDEFEGVGGKDKDDLKELLNTAYKKGGKVIRMRKKKTLDGETQAPEEFKTYRPIVMANIWGMEEVLGDRCVLINIEKSNDFSKTKLVENFDSLIFEWEKARLCEVLCRLCRDVSPRNIYTAWNYYIKETTLNNTNTLTTLNNTKLHEDSLVNSEPDFDVLTKENDTFTIPRGFFDRINQTEIDGRNLELFMPLFLVAHSIGSEDIIEEVLRYAENSVKDKKIEEQTESKDVIVYSLVAKEQPNTWREIKDLTALFRLTLGDGENEWVNSKWMGRALARLNLVTNKRRVGSGRMVMLNVDKAKQKEAIFRPKDETKT